MILVNGGTGLLGSYLLKDLILRGEKIRAIYRSENSLIKTKRVFSYFTNNAQEWIEKIEWVKADITDVLSLQPAFKDVTRVYNCAAIVSFIKSEKVKMFKTNYQMDLR